MSPASCAARLTTKVLKPSMLGWSMAARASGQRAAKSARPTRRSTWRVPSLRATSAASGASSRGRAGQHVEAQGEGGRRLRRVPAGERRDQPGVQPRREEHGHRHVRDQVGAHRILHRRLRAHGLGGDGTVGDAARRTAPSRTSTWCPAGSARTPAGSSAARAPIPRAGTRRARPGRRRATTAPPASSAFTWEAKRRQPPASARVERLDPQRVAGQKQGLLPLVPDRQAVHPPQPGEHGRALAGVEGEHHLGVAPRVERRPRGLQPAAAAPGSCRSRR